MSMKCRTWYALKFKRSFYTSDQRDGYYIKKKKRKRMCAELRNPCNILSCCVYIDCLKCFRNKPQKTKQNICLISFKKNVHKSDGLFRLFFSFPYHTQWRSQGMAGTHAPSPKSKIFHFHAVFGKILENNRFEYPSGVGATPLENPGSTTYILDSLLKALAIFVIS